MISNSFERIVAKLRDIFFEFGILLLRLFVNGRDARAWDDVVELIEADGAPRIGKFRNWILVIGAKRCERGDEFGIVQEELAFAIGAFIARLRGVSATMIFKIQFAVPNRCAVFFVKFIFE